MSLLSSRDTGFIDKGGKLKKSLKFPASFKRKVDPAKVDVAFFKGWVERRVDELGDGDDEVLVEYAQNLLDVDVDAGEALDPRDVQIALLPMMPTTAAQLVKELWALMLEAQENEGGVPNDEAQRRAEEKKRAEGFLERVMAARDRPATPPPPPRIREEAPKQYGLVLMGDKERGGGRDERRSRRDDRDRGWDRDHRDRVREYHRDRDREYRDYRRSDRDRDRDYRDYRDYRDRDYRRSDRSGGRDDRRPDDRDRDYRSRDRDYRRSDRSSGRDDKRPNAREHNAQPPRPKDA